MSRTTTAVLVDRVVDAGVVPDGIMVAAIRGLLRRRRVRELGGDPVARNRQRSELLRQWSSGPIAVATDDANLQHYEVPTDLYRQMLGPNLKYSCCLWPEPATAAPAGLAGAERAMLDLTMARAGLRDGQRILELGCGWGSLTLAMAARLPDSPIVAVSNSATQRRHIIRVAAERDLGNITVVTADVNDFGVDDTTRRHVADGFDRVVSVEMFEHVRNHGRLLERVTRWLRPAGAVFVHVFCHRSASYRFDEATEGDVASGTDWMARHFFTGGVMPSLHHFRDLATSLGVDRTWTVDGRHYAATCQAWRARLDADPERVVATLGGGRLGRARLQRWRVFTMACEELFAFGGGTEWFVAHHLLRPRPGPGTPARSTPAS